MFMCLSAPSAILWPCCGVWQSLFPQHGLFSQYRYPKGISPMQEHVLGSQSKSWWNQAARWLALAGVVGPMLYVGVFTLAGFLRPGYSPVRQAVSALGVGTNAWLLNTDAVVFGVLLFA